MKNNAEKTKSNENSKEKRSIDDFYVCFSSQVEHLSVELLEFSARTIVKSKTKTKIRFVDAIETQKIKFEMNRL